MQIRRFHAATIAAILLAGLATTGANAASKPKPKPVKPVCNLVTDPANDTFLLRSQDAQHQYGPQVDTLDLVRVDMASDAKNVTGVIQVKKLATSDPSAPGGLSFEMDWNIPGATTPVYMAATVNGSTATFVTGTRDATANTATKLATITGVVDLAKNEIRMTAPVSAYAAVGAGMAPGVKIDFAGRDQTASRSVIAASVFADVANGDATYKTGTPSCVKVGQ